MNEILSQTYGSKDFLTVHLPEAVLEHGFVIRGPGIHKGPTERVFGVNRDKKLWNPFSICMWFIFGFRRAKRLRTVVFE
jgi:hypothetical protein